MTESSDHIILRVGPEIATLADLMGEPQPLGSREEVIDELLRICPEPTFDEAGWNWARLEWGDESCTVSVEEGDPVLAIIVSQMSPTFRERLAERRHDHRWRLFEMSEGAEEKLG